MALSSQHAHVEHVQAKQGRKTLQGLNSPSIHNDCDCRAIGHLDSTTLEPVSREETHDVDMMSSISGNAMSLKLLSN